MAKKIKNRSSISSAEDLITSREQTRAGFIAMALEKNYIAIPYIEEAKTLRTFALKARSPKDLFQIKEVTNGLLTASGLSEKSLNYLNEEDKKIAITGLIEKFLEPAGNYFVDELVYRYLLTKGDALGGKARNLAGTLGERKFLRTLISVLNLSAMDYLWKDSNTGTWLDKQNEDVEIEKRISGIYWKNNNHNRLLLLNVKVPVVDKNVDLVVLNALPIEQIRGRDSILKLSDRYVALGELKGGIDPAGADEHWKTANTALIRIRKSFSNINLKPSTFFIGAAIERSMANEIYDELQTEVLTNAANLSNDTQLAEISKWLLNL